ncbi:excitatory amino acid transporter 3-like isoform X2 [Amphiprion ocellaris]|uniref:excitatory amino acid transporter 3-like isoform X2 n=1 Tax=Amphiprion ocellaris TaxID=80972 RepID=UPI0024117571|nr:excitatory amino acid transporter 3-like isoform X2 [Amphiprion ocellaris]
MPGIVIALIINAIGTPTDLQKDLIFFPAEVLLNMLQVITVPLIVTSVIIGVAGLSVNKLSKIAARAVIFFCLTTLLSVTLGLILVLMMKPGVSQDSQENVEEEDEMIISYTTQALMDLIRNFVPKNLVQACFQQFKTTVQEERAAPKFDPNTTMNATTTTMVLVRGYVMDTNALGLIVCSFAIGVSLHHLGNDGKLLLDMIVIINNITRNVVTWILCYLPVGVMFMIMRNVLEVYDWQTASKLIKFMIVVIIGQLIHGLIFLPGIYFLMTRRNPWIVMKGVAPALMTALFISSSSATMPITMRCCARRLKIDRRITRFMMPIGTSTNMDGTALYEVVAAVFIANLHNIYLDVGQLITVGVMAGISSLGAAAIPATGAATTLFVLNSIGLPVKKASILLAVEWLLDRINTVNNVWSDSVGVALVYHLSTAELAEMTEQNDASVADSDAQLESCPSEEADEFTDASSCI